jgi:hypothetical protein
MDANLTARYTAECKALRANYYFNLVRMFKNVPLILTSLATSEYYTVKQATQAAVYAQIEKDLTEAIPVLPPTVLAADTGRFTQGAARALLGKVYLYNNKKTLAAAEFLAVNGTPGGTSQYGYKLMTNFRDLWTVNIKFNTNQILKWLILESSTFSKYQGCRRKWQIQWLVLEPTLGGATANSIWMGF